jgi:hypothetical protein
MANSVVKLKRSAVAGKTPTTTDLQLGEIALNTYDGRLFIKRSVTGTESIAVFRPIATIDDLTDVDTTTNPPIVGQNLQWNGTNWVPVGASSLLTVSLYTTTGTYTSTVTNVTGIRFDEDAGFDVTDLGSGNVKVGMNSTFKTLKVDGQTDLVAMGLDTLQIVAGSGISITTDPTGSPYKTLTINSTGGPGGLITNVQYFTGNGVAQNFTCTNFVITTSSAIIVTLNGVQLKPGIDFRITGTNTIQFVDSTGQSVPPGNNSDISVRSFSSVGSASSIGPGQLATINTGTGGQVLSIDTSTGSLKYISLPNSAIVVSDTAPTSPLNGDIWFNSSII